jgi:hypothetical protein
MLSWSCVVASHHPLASMPGPLSDDTLRNWPSLVREDTSRTLPKRITWLLDNQSASWCLTGNHPLPAYQQGCVLAWYRRILLKPWIDSGEWLRCNWRTFPDAACCLTWQQGDTSPH